jgi:hypothetical protein
VPLRDVSQHTSCRSSSDGYNIRISAQRAPVEEADVLAEPARCDKRGQAASGGLMFSPTDVSEGWQAELGCSDGFARASVSKSESSSSFDFNGGLLTEASNGECDLSAKYVSSAY